MKWEATYKKAATGEWMLAAFMLVKICFNMHSFILPMIFNETNTFIRINHNTWPGALFLCPRSLHG